MHWDCRFLERFKISRYSCENGAVCSLDKPIRCGLTPFVGDRGLSRRNRFELTNRNQIGLRYYDCLTFSRLLSRGNRYVS